jgi:hypothetical protein
MGVGESHILGAYAASALIQANSTGCTLPCSGRLKSDILRARKILKFVKFSLTFGEKEKGSSRKHSG